MPSTPQRGGAPQFDGDLSAAGNDISSPLNADGGSGRPKGNPGLTLAFGSALFYTCYDAGVRVLVGDLTIWGLLFLRGALGVVVLGLLARLFSRPLWGRQSGLLTLIGLVTFGSSVCNTASLANIPLYQALMIIYLYPVFTMLLAAPINGEAITRRDTGLMAVALLGGLGLIWPDEAAGLDFNIYHVVGVFGSVLYSLGQVMTRRLGAGNSGLEPIFYYSMFALIFSIPLSAAFGAGLGLGRASGLAGAFLLAGLGIGAQLTGYAALRWIPGFKVGIIGYSELALGTVISWLVFNDPMSLRALAGGLIVILAAFRLRAQKAVPVSRK